MAADDRNAESADDITAAVIPTTTNMTTHDGVKYLKVNGSISSSMLFRRLVICDWSIIGVVVFVVLLKLSLLLLIKIDLQSKSNLMLIRKLIFNKKKRFVTDCDDCDDGDPLFLTLTV